MFKQVETNLWALSPDSETFKILAKSYKWYSSKYSPKDVPKFFDLSSICESPKAFGALISMLTDRYKNHLAEKPTHIAGYDARGFVIGAPLALQLSLPFVMLRKSNKNPGLLYSSSPYTKEYTEKESETLAVRRDSFPPGSRVVLIDDLIATGGYCNSWD